MSEEKLVLVNFLDKAIGEETKMETHRKGLLHRAFSVFLYNGNQMLIQKRAAGKYLQRDYGQILAVRILELEKNWKMLWKEDF